MEELQAKHRKEQRDLQSRITQKKKNATKKTRKGVNDECEALQRNMEERQKAELDAINLSSFEADVENLEIEGNSDKSAIEGVRNGEKEINQDDKRKPTDDPTSTSHSAPSIQPDQIPSKKPSRQKARLARRAADQELQTAQAEAEAANLPNLREREMAAMTSQMKNLGLKEINIRPDGHCLYSAVATVLPEGELGTSSADIKPYQIVRNATAMFIAHHPYDFEAFLEEPLPEYVSKIKDTAEWGGQLELQAIARAYSVQINVLQADGRMEKIEPGVNSTNEELWLAYYRHSFGLGEHYNALKKES